MKSLLRLLNLAFSLSLLIAVNADERLKAETIYGSLKGKWMKSRSGRDFTAFLGIPYAAPPTGQLRFKPSLPPQKWQELRSATEEGNVCIQRMLNGNEDCLYLNVFTHHTRKEKKELSPVMVYIHGGGFYGGSSSLGIYGPEYLMDRNIVLVTLQYRLGVFGFMSTEDNVIPGNMGLKDQVRALEWVQGNIEAFGGDYLKVTIFGNSAGSVSVHLHMLSPASRHLFSRAISQSGTAFSAFAVIGTGTSRKITHQLASKLNCPINSSEEILKCFQNKNASDIQQEYSDLQDSTYEIKKVFFRPVIENKSDHAFLTSNPLHTNTDKPWLVGLNRNEGLFKIKMQFLNETKYLVQTEFAKFWPAILFFDDTCSKPEEVAQLIQNFYFKNDFTDSRMISSLEQVISDSWFFWPTLQAMERHIGTMYCYLFDHRGARSFTEIIAGPQGFGVSHMDELHYLFPQKQIFPVTFNEEDTNISKLMVNLWVNFVEESNPTPSAISSNPQTEDAPGIVWQLSNNVSQTFFHLETKKLSILQKIFEERMNFWRTLPTQDK